MKFYFSNGTKGFYLVEVHGERIPGDAIALADGEHSKALEWQAKGGLIVGAREDGYMHLAQVKNMPEK